MLPGQRGALPQMGAGYLPDSVPPPTGQPQRLDARAGRYPNERDADQSIDPIDASGSESVSVTLEKTGGPWGVALMTDAHRQHDPSSYYTEQLCTIVFCGTFGGIAVAIYVTVVNNVLSQGLLQYSLLAGGI